jgi:hypothetical protein
MRRTASHPQEARHARGGPADLPGRPVPQPFSVTGVQPRCVSYKIIIRRPPLSGKVCRVCQGTFF